MVNETRYLTFTHRAAMAAIKLYHATVADRPLPGPPVDFQIKTVAPLVGVAQCEAAGGRLEEIHFNREQLFACLLHLCRKQRIALPRRADKTLVLDGHELCLAMTTQLRSTTPTPAAASA